MCELCKTLHHSDALTSFRCLSLAVLRSVPPVINTCVVGEAAVFGQGRATDEETAANLKPLIQLAICFAETEEWRATNSPLCHLHDVLRAWRWRGFELAAWQLRQSSCKADYLPFTSDLGNGDLIEGAEGEIDYFLTTFLLFNKPQWTDCLWPGNTTCLWQIGILSHRANKKSWVFI